MPTYPIASQLEPFSQEELYELRDRALEFLQKEGLYEFERCAKYLNLHIGQFFELKSRFPQHFREVDLAVVARAQNAMLQIGLGKIEAKPSQMAALKKILETKSLEYRPSSKITVGKEDRRPPSNGKGEKIMDKYLEGKDGAEGSLLRNKTLQ